MDVPTANPHTASSESPITTATPPHSTPTVDTTNPTTTTAGAQPGTPTREYDLILVGASGFVGKLATQHLLEKYGSTDAPFSWALAARNKERLTQVHRDIGKPERLAEVPVILGDVDDPAFCATLAQKTKVLAASLAPYSLRGTGLIAACVEHGTHYVDISGEMLWIKENIDKFHEPAQAKGVRIVHAYGLGSVPADLSVYLILQRLRHHRIEPTELKFLNGPMYSSLGGGSMTSYATLIAMAKKQGKILTMLDPHFLTPPSTSSVSADKTKAQKQLRQVSVAPKMFGVGWDSDIHRFTAPLWLAALDDEIVVRSASLLGYPAFRYVEAQTYSSSFFGFMSAWWTFVGAYLLAACLYFAPTRWLLTKLRPPGSGPNRYIRERGWGKMFLVAKGETPLGGEATFWGEFYIPNGDPGYQETSKMLIESALCLVLDLDKLPHGGTGTAEGNKQGGVLTPAAAFGQVLMERLEKASKMKFRL
jgi:short subunit dehydrogenase-like uncharacterized protein